MRMTVRMVGAIVFVVGCILQGLSFYLLYYNWFYEEASNIGFLVNLSITSSFIWLEGIILFKLRSKLYPKKVLSLFASSFTLLLLGFSVLTILENFWLFLPFFISGIATASIIVFYELSHPEKKFY
jgi:hypothetical protein